MATLIKPATLGDVLKWEDNPAYSREIAVLAAGKKYALGTVLGRKSGSGAVTVGAAVADAGNTGNGTLTLAGTPSGASVKEGNYRIIFSAPTKANVENPDGVNVGVATVGSAFNKDIAFTIAAGGTAFAAGDALTVPVSVAANDGTYDEWDPAAGDGTGSVAGVLIFDVDATAGVVESVAVVREAMVSRDALVFKSGTSAAAKSDAYAGLAKLSIAVRQTA